MSDGYDPHFEQWGQTFNVDPILARAVMQVESSGQPGATSPSGARGLMQLMDENSQRLGIRNPYEPQQSIAGGTRMLDEALTAANGNVPLALRIYQGGSDQSKWGAQNAAYPAKVAAAYRKLAMATAAPASSPDRVDDFLTGAQTAAPASAAPAETEASKTLDDFLTGANAPNAPNAPAHATLPEPTVTQKIGAGIGRGLHDMTDVPAEYLAKGADTIGLTEALNKLGIAAPSAPAVTAADAAERQAYDQTYGASPIATTARVGTQIAGTLPMLSTGGGVLRAGGDVAAAAAGRVAPWLGRASEGVSALVSGDRGGGLLARGASLAANGALQGGAAGVLTAGQSDQPIGSQALNGALIGGVVGPAAGIAAAGMRGAYSLASGMGGGASPEVARLAQLARDTYGIPITAPQMSDNSLLRIANDQSSKLPFSGAGAQTEVQQTAWQRAVSRAFGENVDQVTPEVMDRAATRIGGVFNGVARRTKIDVDTPLIEELSRIETEAASAPLGHGGHDAIRAQVDNILGAGSDGAIDGQAYQQLTRSGAPLQRAQAAGDPNVRYYAGQIREALDNAFQRSAAPEDQAALAQARRQYRAMKTVEDLVEKSPDGNLSPALLMGQVRNASSRFDPSTGGMAYTGGGELGDLARIGQRFFKPQPNSGTADRMLVNSILGGGGAAGAAAGVLVNPLAAAPVPLMLGVNRAVGSYLRSGGYASRVIDSSLNPRANPFLRNLVPYAAPIGSIGRNGLTGP